jgi:hypothetical protein
VWGGGENRGQRGKGPCQWSALPVCSMHASQWLGACGLQGGAPTAILGEQGGEELRAEVCSGCGWCASSPSRVCACSAALASRELCVCSAGGDKRVAQVPVL